MKHQLCINASIFNNRFIWFSQNLLCVGVIALLQACTTTSTSSDNPWETPSRGYSVSSQEEVEELEASMQPCIDYARNTFSEAYSRYLTGSPPNTNFYVVARNDQDRHTYSRVIKVSDDTITSNINSTESINGRNYSAGDKLLLDVSQLVDWLIVYPDRPEEGNLLGKYMLMRQEGLMSGFCDPHHSEFQHFRLFRENYSFVPPSEPGWLMRGRDANAEVSLATVGVGGANEVNTLYADRYRAPLFATDQELINKIMETEKKNVGDPNRVTLLEHEVTAYKGKETRCVLSHQVIEDKQALLDKSGKRSLMIREILSLVCVHPKAKDTVVTLAYSHRYHPGHRDTEFPDKANNVFKTLAFKIQN